MLKKEANLLLLRYILSCLFGVGGWRGQTHVFCLSAVSLAKGVRRSQPGHWVLLLLSLSTTKRQVQQRLWVVHMGLPHRLLASIILHPWVPLQ